MEKIINNLLNILFPSRCLGCSLKGEILCESCIAKIPEAERETSEKIVALYDYRNPIIKSAIWELKYHHERHLGEKLGKLLYEAFLEETSELRIFSKGQPIYVIPVPISSLRKKSRGYNQSETIARRFCHCAPAKTFVLSNNLVMKIKDTIPQARITDRKRRLDNIKDAFKLKNIQEAKGKTFIIIDDVTTTGATIGEIMKLLKKAGAKKVVGFAVAH